ncbi:MAG: NAD(P)/FAD-dependent oxidoreductase [Acidobacteriota bacterium]
MASIGILGAGPAGLAAALRLARSGLSVHLFEAAPELGGLARSFELDDVTIERYYHFLCGVDQGYFDLLEELDLSESLRWRTTRMGYYFHGRLYPFSSSLDLLRFGGTSLLGRIRYGLSALYASWIEDWRPLDARRAEPWLISMMGESAYRATWYPLLSRKFPGVHDQISAAWVWHRIHRVARSRKTLFHKERLGHLVGGTQTLVDALEARLGALDVTVHRETPAERILIEDRRAVGVSLAGDSSPRRFDHMLSAVPLPVFHRLLEHVDDPWLDELATHEFLAVVCVVLRLRRPISENFWTNVDDPRISFNGVIEYTNLNPEITPDGSSIVYVPYYLPREDPRYRRDDDSLIAECVEALRLIQPALADDDVLSAAVSRDPFAQVVCPAGFAERVPGHETPFRGLYLVESSQLYPSDRTISGTIDLAHAAVERVLAAETRSEATP